MNTFDDPNLTFRLNDYLKTNKTPNNKLFSKKAIEKHNSTNDCFVGMSGKVYNMSQYYNDLIVRNRPRSLGVICGSILDINPIQIFKEDNYNNYEVGYIEYYLLKKIIYLIVLLVVFILSFYLGFISNSKYKVIFKIILLLLIIKLIIWLLQKYNYKNSLKFEKDYIS
jgi:hypothetical protein